MDFETWAEPYRRAGYPEQTLRQAWERQRIGPVEGLGRGLLHGLYGMAESVGTGLQFFGADELGQSVQDYWANKAAEYAPPPQIQGSIMDNPGLLADPTWWTYNVGEMAPFTVSTMIPGVAGFKAAKVLGLGQRAAQALGTAAGALPGGFFEAMPDYRQSLQEGMDPTEARLRAAANAGAIAGLNAIPLSNVFGPGGLAKRMAVGAITQGGEEWAEEPTTAAIYGKDIGQAAWQGANVIPTSMLMGALMPAGAGNQHVQEGAYQQAAEAQPANGWMTGKQPVAAWSDIDTSVDLSHYRKLKGAFAGVPKEIQTQEAADAQQQQLLDVLDRAQPDDFTWYERFGEYFRSIAPKDPAAREQLYRVTALLSSDDTVANNANHVVKAAHQILEAKKQGKPWNEFLTNGVGHYPNSMAAYIQNALTAKEFTPRVTGVGHKVWNFYRNLKDAAEGANEAPEAVTVDRHMLHALGFPDSLTSAGNKTKTNPMTPPPRYRFGQEALLSLTHNYNKTHGTNLLPRQIQAALWSQYMRERGLFEGDMARELQRSTMNVTWEAKPSESTSAGRVISSLPKDRQEAYTRDAAAVIHDDRGQDLLADMIGIPLYSQAEGEGAYEGQIAPNRVTGILARHGSGYDKAEARAYARAIQYIYTQDAVPFFRADERADTSLPEYAEAVRIRFNDLDQKAEENVYEQLRSKVHDDIGFTRIGNDLIVVNYRDGGKPIMMPDTEFLAKVNDLLASGELGQTEAHRFGVEGEYIGDWNGNWKTDPEGNALLGEVDSILASTPAAERRPVVLDWLRDRREAAQKIAQAYTRQYFSRNPARTANEWVTGKQPVETWTMRDKQGFARRADGDLITESPEFKRWSGNAPVVKLAEAGEHEFKSGEPVVIEALHGTDADFSSFDTSKLGFNTGAKSAKGGFFFTNNPEAAALYPVYDEHQLLEAGGFLRKMPPHKNFFDTPEVRAAEEKVSRLMREDLELAQKHQAWDGVTQDKIPEFKIQAEKIRAAQRELDAIREKIKSSKEYQEYKRLKDEARRASEEDNILQQGARAITESQRLIREIDRAVEDGNLSVSKEEDDALYYLYTGAENLSPDEPVSISSFQDAIDVLKASPDKRLNRYAELHEKIRAAKIFEYQLRFSRQAAAGGDMNTGEVWDAKKKNVQPNIIPVYLKMKNPYVHDYRGGSYRDVSYADLIKKAKSEGHDGLILKHTKDPMPMDVYVAFKPEQIKFKFAGGQAGGKQYFSRNPETLDITEERAPYTFRKLRGNRFAINVGKTKVSGHFESDALIVDAVDLKGNRFDEGAAAARAVVSEIQKQDKVGVFDTKSPLPESFRDEMARLQMLGITGNMKKYDKVIVNVNPEAKDIAADNVPADLVNKAVKIQRQSMSNVGREIGISDSPPGQYVGLLDMHNSVNFADNGAVIAKRGTPEEQQALGSALADLQAAGMPDSWLESVDDIGALDGTDLNTQGSYLPQLKTVGIQRAILSAIAKNPGNVDLKQALRLYLSHEIGHSIDIDADNRPMSSSSELLRIDPDSIRIANDHLTGDMGPVMAEMVSVYEKGGPGIPKHFSYPLARVGELRLPEPIEEIANKYGPSIARDVLAAREELRSWLQAEAFAQISAFYINNPAWLRENMPQSFAMMEEIKNGTQSASIDERHARVRAALRSSGPIAGPIKRSGGSFREAAKSLGGRQADTGVRNLQTDQVGGRGAAGTDVYFSRSAEEERRYAGNINIDNLGHLTPEAEQLIRDTAKMFSSKKARRGTIPWEQTEAMAEALGMDPKDLAARVSGTAFNAEQLERARTLVEESARRTMALAKQAMSTGNPADIVAAYELMLQHATLQTPYSGAVAEAGRALNILRKTSSEAKSMKDILESDVSMEEKVAMIAELDTPGQVSQFARRAHKVKAWDVLFEVWINALLTGPPTHVVNATSNTLVDVFSNVENAVAAAIGKLHGGEKVTFRETQARAIAMAKAGAEAARLAKKAFQTEETTGQNKIEARRYQAIRPENFGVDPESGLGMVIEKTGRIIRLPGRALQASDEFFKAVARRSAVAGLAVRQAFSEGLEGAELDARIKELTQNPTDQILRQAEGEAAYMTFTNKLGPLGRGVQAIAAKVPVVRLIIPFIRTPANIVKFAVDRSPLSLATQRFWQDVLIKKGAARDLAIARVITGTGLMTAVMMLTAAGKITGGGPPDPREKGLKYRTGWQPYSILDGDQWVSYNRLEPLGMLFGIAADLQEIKSADDMDQVASMLIASVSKNITSKTWLRGLSEAIMALSDPERYGDRYWQNLSGTLVPTGVAHLARVDDPVLRDARSVVDKWMSRIPGQSQKLMPRRDTAGRPITREGGIGPDILSPAYVSQVKSDPVAEELLRVGIGLGKPSRRILGVKLEPGEYDAYAQLAGQIIEQRLAAIIGSPAYQRLPEYAKRNTLEKIILASRQAARAAVLRQWPQILSRRAQEKRAQMAM